MLFFGFAWGCRARRGGVTWGYAFDKFQAGQKAETGAALC